MTMISKDFAQLHEAWEHTVCIFKLHGTMSKPHTVISTNINELSEEKEKALKKAIEQCNVIVFIGYSLRDEDVFRALENSLPNGANRWIYWCIRSNNEINEKVEDFLKIAERKDFNVRVVRIKSATDFMKKLWRSYRSRFKPEKITLVRDEERFCQNRFDIFVKGFDYIIVDPIWGMISPEGIDELEQEWENLKLLLECGAMQRMKHIKQLSTAFLAHPSATHTRYEHMLGVFNLAKDALMHFKNKRNNLDFLLASLLHDIGHGPFGHVIECLIDRIKPEELNHEDYTKKYISEGFLDLNKALKKIRHTRDNVIKFLDRKKVDKKYYHLAMLISNEGFDLDRLDFLIRDFHFSGIKAPEELENQFRSSENLIEFKNRLIESLAICELEELPDNIKNEIEKYTGRKDITILYFDEFNNERIKDDLDLFFKLYIVMYYNVYYGERNKSLQAMLTKALYFAYDLGEIDIEELPALTDPELLTLLEKSSDARVRELAKCVRYGFAFKPLLRFNAEGLIEKLRSENKSVSDVERELEQKLREIQKGKSFKGRFLTGIEDLVIIDLQRPKKICDLVYIKSKDGGFEKYDIEFNDESVDNTGKTYGKLCKELTKWRAFVFVHPTVVEDEDMKKTIIKEVKEILGNWNVKDKDIYEEYCS